MNENNEKSAREKETAAMLEAHNIQQVLELIKFLVGQNSEMPGFIMKLYAIWVHTTLTKLTNSKTLLPKEDIDVLRSACDKQFITLKEELEKMFISAETIERVKAAQEAKRSGM
jgi:hypothetical protein